MSLDQIWIPNIIYLLEALCDSLTMQAMNRILGAALYDLFLHIRFQKKSDMGVIFDVDLVE